MTVDDLRTKISGSVIRPGDADWEEARRFHAGIGEPTVVIRASSVDDVRSAVRYAAAESLDVLVRGGGHSAWGEVPGGMTIDIAALDRVDVDGETVRIGGGARWGDVARVLAGHGLAISSGDTASVGVGGLTLGGGIGWMVRAWGLAADQLVGAEVVTARGELLEVTDDSHPDLMWALRGGGGNFGVVTRFDFRAHPLDGVVLARFGHDGDARVLLRALADVMRGAPRELTVTFMDVPAMDPSAPGGLAVTAVWAGPDEHAARVALAPLRAAPGVTELEFAAMAYADILLDMPAFDPDAPPPGFVGGNTLLRELDDEAIDRFVAFREAHAASVLFLRSLGGAFGDVPQDDTPFPGRDATWFAMAGAFDIPGLLDDAHRADAEAAWAAIEGLGAGIYGNFSPSTDPSWVPRMFPPATLGRLRAVKRVWDPENMFCRNHNVRPA